MLAVVLAPFALAFVTGYLTGLRIGGRWCWQHRRYHR